jgi:hypothetical protein
MSSGYGATRWWEYYAVRYLMPSVAGTAIVEWICLNGDNKLLALLCLPSSGAQLATASVVLLFLYGNLFCYIASYPVLVFHATRVMDFEGDRWARRALLDGYIATSVLVLSAILVAQLHGDCRYWAAFLLAFLFALVQLWRVWFVASARVVVKGCRGVDGKPGDVTVVYGYSYTLSTRRGRPAKTTKTQDPPLPAGADDDERVTTNLGEVLWHKDFMDTYRHLREHGNSAFIFLLEVGLAALVYSITKSERSAGQQLSAIGVLFAIWAAPAVLVHLIGQHLERRFSHFDRRLPSPEDRASLP